MLIAKGEKKTQLTYTQWLKAFYVFVTVWCKKYHYDVANILKYADTIRELYVSQARWQYYVELFRRARQRSGWPWQSLQMELWEKSMALCRDCEEMK